MARFADATFQRDKVVKGRDQMGKRLPVETIPVKRCTVRPYVRWGEPRVVVVYTTQTGEEVPVFFQPEGDEPWFRHPWEAWCTPRGIHPRTDAKRLVRQAQERQPVAVTVAWATDREGKRWARFRQEHFAPDVAKPKAEAPASAEAPAPAATTDAAPAAEAA